MKKVKILKVTTTKEYNGYHDEYEFLSLFHPVAGDWEEVTEEEYAEIKDALQYANRKMNQDFHYILVEYTETTKEEMFKSASDFKEKMLKQKEREEKAREEAKRKREEKAQERKRKQLEKLKKELGES